MKEDFWIRDLPIFFAGMGQVVRFESGKLRGKTVTGVFDVKFYDQDFGSMRVAAENSQFLARSEDLAGAQAEDVLSLAGRTYRIAAVHHDLTGAALLDLAEGLDFIPPEEEPS